MQSKSIPNADAVNRALQNVDIRIKGVVKRINGEAAKLIRSGDYEGSEKWVKVAKSVRDYQSRLGAFSREWQTLLKTTKVRVNAGSQKQKPVRTPKSPKTPAWKFYIPLLQSLQQLNRQAKMEELIPGVEKLMKSNLTDGDRARHPRRNIPWWQVTALKLTSRLKNEGWVKKDRDKRLTLTDAGIKAIQNDAGPEK